MLRRLGGSANAYGAEHTARVRRHHGGAYGGTARTTAPYYGTTAVYRLPPADHGELLQLRL